MVGRLLADVTPCVAHHNGASDPQEREARRLRHATRQEIQPNVVEVGLVGLLTIGYQHDAQCLTKVGINSSRSVGEQRRLKRAGGRNERIVVFGEDCVARYKLDNKSPESDIPSLPYIDLK